MKTPITSAIIEENEDAIITIISEIIPELPVSTLEEDDKRRGQRKIIENDGTISYGLTIDGKPRSKPGRKPKPVV